MQKGKPLNGMVTQQRGLSTARRVGAALPQHVGVFAGLFGAYLPDAQAKDFCEMEIASAGIVRGFMAVPCVICVLRSRRRYPLSGQLAQALRYSDGEAAGFAPMRCLHIENGAYTAIRRVRAMTFSGDACAAGAFMPSGPDRSHRTHTTGCGSSSARRRRKGTN